MHFLADVMSVVLSFWTVMGAVQTFCTAFAAVLPKDSRARAICLAIGLALGQLIKHLKSADKPPTAAPVPVATPTPDPTPPAEGEPK